MSSLSEAVLSQLTSIPEIAVGPRGSPQPWSAASKGWLHMLLILDNLGSNSTCSMLSRLRAKRCSLSDAFVLLVFRSRPHRLPSAVSISVTKLSALHLPAIVSTCTILISIFFGMKPHRWSRHALASCQGGRVESTARHLQCLRPLSLKNH